VKANEKQIGQALDKGAEGTPFILLHGPDEAGARTFLTRLVRAMGADAERIDLTGSELKADPARLSDEAAAFSLFGGKRFIVITFAGTNDEPAAAVEALLASDTSANPVIALTGATLKAGSAVLKAATAHPRAMACICYFPNVGDLDKAAEALGREQGLRLSSQLCRRISRMASGDRAIMAREIEKLALYLDAAPERPVEVDPTALDAISAESGEPELNDLIDAVFSGNPAGAAQQLARLASEGVEGITLLRAAQRRVLLLVKLHSQIAGGRRTDQVLESVFFKERASVERQLKRWSPDRTATANRRLIATERAVKASGTAGTVLADVELIALARAAQREA
jgi:DNA polymerase III subunit delta